MQVGLGESEKSSLESLESSRGGDLRRRLTRVHTLVEEDRTFGCNPNPLLQPPLVPTGCVPPLRTAWPSLKRLTLNPTFLPLPEAPRSPQA